jgi:hypothetical protein
MSDRPMTEDDLAGIIAGLEGWCTPRKAKILYDLVLASDARMSVELGVFGGRSLIPLALAHRHKGSGFATGVDPWEARSALEGGNDPRNNAWWSGLDLESIYAGFVRAVLAHDLTYRCRWVRATSDAAVGLFADESVTLLHQDSNHSELVSCGEVRLWAPKVRSGGYWVIDDTDWPTTSKAQRLLLQLGFREVRDEDGWRVLRKL